MTPVTDSSSLCHMELASSNGNSVSLAIDGYQFPAISGSGDRDWDANWLVIKGRVTAGDEEWTFRDPCLTTWEGRELSSWLRSVADGSQQPAPVDQDGEGGELLVFTEPNVAFNLHAATPEGAIVRLYLSLESLPKSMAGTDIFEYFVELVLNNAALEATARDWDAELRAFPVRA